MAVGGWPMAQPRQVAVLNVLGMYQPRRKPRVVTKEGKVTYPDKVVVDQKPKQVVNPTEVKTGDASLSKGQKSLQKTGGTIQSKKYPEYNGVEIKPNSLNVERVNPQQ